MGLLSRTKLLFLNQQAFCSWALDCLDWWGGGGATPLAHKTKVDSEASREGLAVVARPSFFAPLEEQTPPSTMSSLHFSQCFTATNTTHLIGCAGGRNGTDFEPRIDNISLDVAADRRRARA